MCEWFRLRAVVWQCDDLLIMTDVGYGVVYRIEHFFFSFFRVSSAARVACSKTSLTPSFVLAEHSRYFWAPIFLRTSSACSEKILVECPIAEVV